MPLWANIYLICIAERVARFNPFRWDNYRASKHPRCVSMPVLMTLITRASGPTRSLALQGVFLINEKPRKIGTRVVSAGPNCPFRPGDPGQAEHHTKQPWSVCAHQALPSGHMPSESCPRCCGTTVSGLSQQGTREPPVLLSSGLPECHGHWEHPCIPCAQGADSSTKGSYAPCLPLLVRGRRIRCPYRVAWASAAPPVADRSLGSDGHLHSSCEKQGWPRGPGKRPTPPIASLKANSPAGRS